MIVLLKYFLNLIKSEKYPVKLNNKNNKRNASSWCVENNHKFKRKIWYYEIETDALFDGPGTYYDIVFYFYSPEFALSFKLMGF